MKGTELIRKLRAYAKARELPFEVRKQRGKGAHQMLYLGNRKTTIPGPVKELKIKTLRSILRNLAVDPDSI